MTPSAHQHALALSLGLAIVWNAHEASTRQPDRPATVTIPYADVKSLVAAEPADLPVELATRTAQAIEEMWPRWAAQRDRDIRTRVEEGDEDSLVNLWLYGTSFTTLPRAREGSTPTGLVEQRLEDFVSALAAPGANARLQLARRVVERAGIDPGTLAGRDRLRRHLLDLRARARAQFDGYARELASAVRDDPDAGLPVLGSLFRERGISSDTSLLPDFAVDQALEAVASQGLLAPGSVHRVAIVGPGLDVINKADGQDFYPEQMTQPFAVIDSLVRLGLATEADLAVTTFDVSPRVLDHVSGAIARAGMNTPYTVQLRLSQDERWSDGLVQFFNRVGDRIGDAATPISAPANSGTPRLRAVRVRPAVVRALRSEDLNVVLERLALPAGQRFDLIVATNVLVYYGTFEQALALTNIAAMLEPGGVLLSNNLLLRVPAGWTTPPLHLEVAYSDRQRDHMFLYRRTAPSAAGQ